jgi:hypothetical protein
MHAGHQRQSENSNTAAQQQFEARRHLQHVRPAHLHAELWAAVHAAEDVCLLAF